MGKTTALSIAVAMLLPATASAQTHYYVYCASDKIEVDSRSPEQMKIARGSGVCQFAQFNFRMDAESFAKKNFGGAGKKCACK